MPFNWIDWIIIASLCYYAYRGWETGLFQLATSLISFVISLWFAMKFQFPVSAFLAEKFGIASGWSVVIAYIVIAFGMQLVMDELFNFFLGFVPKKIIHSKVSNWVGAVVAAFNGLVWVTFILVIILALPLRGTIKRDIGASAIGSRISSLVAAYGGPIQSAVNDMKKQAVKFFTVNPKSTDSIGLDVAPQESDLRIAEEDEKAMLQLVNAQRATVGAPLLVVDETIVAVARAHSRDMFMRRYFSHYSPEGKDAGDRLQAGHVLYALAGENLAYAPDVTIAHDGLMNSPDHKKNILDPQFHRIGIGIISTDSFGIMVTQDFAN